MMNGRKTLLFLFTFFVLNCSVCFAQLSKLNLVYSGGGGRLLFRFEPSGGESRVGLGAAPAPNSIHIDERL